MWPRCSSPPTLSPLTSAHSSPGSTASRSRLPLAFRRRVRLRPRPNHRFPPRVERCSVVGPGPLMNRHHRRRAPATGSGSSPLPAAPTGVDEGSRPVGTDVPLTAEQWAQTVRPGLRGMARAVYAPATLLTSTPDTVTFLLPNPVHRAKCEEHRPAVEAAIQSVTGRATCDRAWPSKATSPPLPQPRRRHHRRSPTASEPAPTSAPAAPSEVAACRRARYRPRRRSPPHQGRRSRHRPSRRSRSRWMTRTSTPTTSSTCHPKSVKSPIDRLAQAFPGSELIDERS